MSDLQLSLILVGALVIAGVYIFNRWQENKYRRAAEKAFTAPARDVLMEKTAGGERHVDRPSPSPAVVPEEPKPPYVEPVLGLEHANRREAFEFSREIDYAVLLKLEQAVTGRQIKEAVDRFRYTGKPVRWRGKVDGTGAWQEVTGPTQIFSEVQVGLQLANRAGAATEVDIASFVGMVKNVAAELRAKPAFPDEAEALERAQGLDEFCSAVDLLIGINVVSTDGTPLHATKVRALAEAEGLVLGADGAFHARNDAGEILFSLTNQEGRPFSPEQMKTMTTTGITFLLDVPRVREGVRALERLVVVARNCSQALHGIVVDDNRKPLSDPEVKRIRAQLDEIYSRMSARGIAGGSAVAARLFSE